MSGALDDVLEELGRVEAIFRRELGQCLEAIYARMSALPETPSSGDLEPLIREVHSIAGTAGVLGLQTIGIAAGKLEAVLLGIASSAGNDEASAVRPLCARR